jgi:serine/threonine protein kinase
MGDVHGMSYVVLDSLDVDLGTYIRSRGRLSEDNARGLFRQVCARVHQSLHSCSRSALSSDFVVAACLYHPANLPGRVHCVPQLVSAVAHAHKHGVVLRHIRLEKIHLTDETQTQLVFADLQVSWPPSIPASCLHCFVVAVLTPQCDCVAGSYRGTSQQRSSLRAQECV